MDWILKLTKTMVIPKLSIRIDHKKHDKLFLRFVFLLDKPSIRMFICLFLKFLILSFKKKRKKKKNFNYLRPNLLN